MAANRIRGITIEIDGNTTKLSKALEGVNKDIKSTQAQLKDVDKLLQLNPGNFDLIAQKSQLLNKAVDDTKEKLAVLSKAMEQMDAEGVDKSSEAYMGLQREIIQTKNELKDLQTEAVLANEKVAKIEAAADKVANGAGKIANATKGISGLAGAGLAGLAGMGLKAAASADELNTLAKQTGLSTDMLQKFSYASDLVDVSVDDMTGAVTKLKKNMASSSSSITEAFDKLGVAVTDNEGNYRDLETVFFETIEALSHIENEVERDTVAMDLFGKSADSLAGIIDDGGESLRALGEEAENKGIIISDEDLAAANELNDTLDKLKATLTGSIGQAAAQTIGALTPLIESIAEGLTKVAEIIANMSPETLKIIAIVLSVIAAISPIAGIISGIATVISTITPIIAAVNAVIAANPVVLIIMGIIAAVGLLIAAGVALYKNWDEIKAKISELWENFKEKFEAIKEKVTDVFTKVKETVSEKIKEIKETITGKIKEIIEGAKTWGKDIIENLVDGIKNGIQKVKDAVSAVANTIKDFLGFSEPDKGPLSNFHTFMPDMIDLMDKGLMDGAKQLENPLGVLASKLVPDPVYNVNYNDSAVTSRLDSINGSLNRTQPVNVNVSLEGDARGVFRMVRQESIRVAHQTGKSASY